MTLNTSSKICISKRLTIISLLLIMVGFSVVVFSTLSSSVNKTTSSKASGTESNMLFPIGGWGDQCQVNTKTAADYTTFPFAIYWKLTCKEDVDLTCVAPLDFWFRFQESRDVGKETKCLKYSEVPMGTEGALCLDVPERTGQSRCKDKLVCAKIFKDTFPTSSVYDYLEYLYKKYDASTRAKLTYTLDLEEAKRLNKYHLNRQDVFRDFVTYQMGNFAHIDKNFLKEPPGICIPSSLSTAENCGEVGQPSCIKEVGDFCNNSRDAFNYDEMKNNRPWVCVPNIKVDKKTLIQCDNRSNSCNDFCGSIGSKCVDTCEETIDLKLPGRDLYDGVSKLRGGLFEIGKDYKLTGKCTDKYLHSSPDYDIMTACGKNINDGTAKVMCCCDKK